MDPPKAKTIINPVQTVDKKVVSDKMNSIANTQDSPHDYQLVYGLDVSKILEKNSYGSSLCLRIFHNLRLILLTRKQFHDSIDKCIIFQISITHFNNFIE